MLLKDLQSIPVATVYAKEAFYTASSNNQDEKNRKIQQQILNELESNVIRFGVFLDTHKLLTKIFNL